MAHPLLAEQNGIAEKENLYTRKQIKQKSIILKQDILLLLLNIYIITYMYPLNQRT